MADRDHPVFAACYAGLASLTERGGLARLRRRTLAPATGRLLIIGAGQGHDLTHLPPAVTSVVAVEPDAAMRRRGARRVAAAPVPTSYVAAAAEHLPLRDASIDAVLCTLVLCSVADLGATVAELRRVLKPGGPLLVLEHVRSSRSTVAFAQDRLDTAWTRISGGCHLNRDMRTALERGGFDTTGLVDRRLAKLLPLLDPAVQGVAVPRYS